MTKRKKWFILMLVALAGIFLAAVTWAGIMPSGRSNRGGAGNMDIQDKSKRPKDPCWFLLKEGGDWTYEMYWKRQQREMQGYPSDIPLAEAIRIFNEEKQCNPTLAPYPLLTENEVVAAIVAAGGYETFGVWQAQKDMLFKIAKDKVMPKGSLIVAGAGANIQESPLRPRGEIKAKGISIAIFLGMENHEYGQELKREQIFEIRRTYFSVDTIK
jgi:hypothetical protein